MKIKYFLFNLIFISSISYAINMPASVSHKSVETWLTFDACSGDFDFEIAKLLVKNEIKSSIFVTSIWMDKNPKAVEFLKSHPEVFRIENHGKLHHAAVFSPVPVYKVKTVLDERGLSEEVFFNQKKIEYNFGKTPHWFRGATALYDKSSLAWFKENHIDLAGYTIAVDLGATATESQIYENFKKAKKGDILIMHINKPFSQNYKGLLMSLTLIKKLNPSWS